MTSTDGGGTKEGDDLMMTTTKRAKMALTKKRTPCRSTRSKKQKTRNGLLQPDERPDGTTAAPGTTNGAKKVAEAAVLLVAAGTEVGATKAATSA